MGLITPITIIGIGSLSILLGVVALVSSNRSAEKLFFSIFSFSMAAWSIFIGLFLLTNSSEAAEVFVRLYYAAALGIIYALLLYLIFSKINPHRYTFLLIAAGIAVITTICLVLFSGSLFERINIIIHQVELNLHYYAFYVALFGAISIAIANILIRDFRQYVKPKKRNQRVLIEKIIVAVCLPLAIMANLILPIFNLYQYIAIGPLLVFPVVITYFYAIMKYKLFEIRAAIIRTLVYILSLATLSLFYYLLAVTLSHLFFAEFSTEQIFINTGMALIIAFLFQPLRRFFDKLTNKLFYRNEYNADVFYAELNRILTTTNDLKTLLTEVSIKISESLRAEHVSVYVTADGQKVRCAGTAKFVKLPPQDVDTLNEHVRAHGDAIIQIENLYDDERSLRRLMRSNKLSIIAPLVQYDVIVGYLCLGDHKSSHYSERDIKAIDTVAGSIVIAVQNALSIQQVKDLNANLQQRIDDATSELRKSNAQLQRLDEAKDEFISMASHQLRTPLTSIKGYIDMVLEGDAGEIDDMQRHLLSEAFSSSERMVHLINDFLNVSRLQTGKFIIEKVPTDMAKLVRQEVDLLEVNAHQRQMTFDLKLGKTIPKLVVDEGKIRQVVMNFLDNSLYYSHADTAIVVSLKAKDGQLELTVKDTGIGVPEKEQMHLFTKFYRASNARRQRPDGTGVGLFLAKKVITAHGGRILFRSEEGKGSTFGFVLPIDTLRIKD